MIETTAFGATRTGEAVTLYTLDNGSGMRVELLDYGCAIRSLTVPARDGRSVDVALGYDTLLEYEEHDGCLGAVVGRYANRIAEGRFSLGGKTYSLACNNGPNHLHGGLRGFDRQVWPARLLEDGVVFSRLSPDGEEGYPGNLRVSVAYRLAKDNVLELLYEAECDADTVLNLTNHAYFNLSGGGSVLDHLLQINASRFTEVTGQCLPTGRIRPVNGTPLDFRSAKPVGRDLEDDCQQLRNVGGYDHNFVLDAADLNHRAARLVSPDTGIALEVRTDMPGMQLYTSNALTPRGGKGGTDYLRRCALCLETQFFPDAPNHPEFPSPVLSAGARYRHVTRFAFSHG